MVVNYTAAGWEIITQRAHGLLAAQIAAQWKYKIRTERWIETLLAIAEHDDAQVELERDNILTPQGGPVNFKMKAFEYQYCAQTMNFAMSKSRYIGLLCSMHLDFVYRKESAENVLAAKFIREQKILQKKWRKDLNLTIAEAERDYRMLEWCDALSLLLCQHQNQPESRTIEISNGPEDKSYQLIQIAPGILTVNPWPFQDQNFKLYFETRLIPQLAFKNANEFKQAFGDADVSEKRWLFQKQTT